MNKYFHELTEKEYRAILAEGITYGELAEKYLRPSWCDYPDALSPLGCWSLTGGKVTGEDYCKNCDLYKKAK